MAEYIKREMPDMNGTGERKAYYKIKTYSNLRSEDFTKVYVKRKITQFPEPDKS